MRRRFGSLGLFLLVVLAIAISAHARASRPRGWDDATHGRDAAPDYARVFAADRVKRLDIAVTAADWAAMMADMTIVIRVAMIISITAVIVTATITSILAEEAG